MRPILVVAVVTAIVLLRVGTASADARPVTWSAASHDATVEGDHITWRTTYVGNDAPATRGDLRVDLATPLRAEPADVHASRLVRVVQAGGAITAFEFTDEIGWREALTVTVVQHIDDRHDVTLAPPLARGDAVQVVTLTGQDTLRFEPLRSTDLVRHVGFAAPDDVDDAARAQCDELLGRRFPTTGAPPIYVRGTSHVVTAGMRGVVTNADERSRPGLVGAVFAFFLIAIGLMLGYRRLAGQAREEQAEAAINEEFARVERGATRR